MYLFKIDMTTYRDIEDCIYKIGEILSEYYNVDDFEIEEIYEDREFQYNQFKIQLNDNCNDTFHFEQFHKQYNFETDKMYGFYRLVASTTFLKSDTVEDIIIEYNKL